MGWRTHNSFGHFGLLYAISQIIRDTMREGLCWPLPLLQLLWFLLRYDRRVESSRRAVSGGSAHASYRCTEWLTPLNDRRRMTSLKIHRNLVFHYHTISKPMRRQGLFNTSHCQMTNWANLPCHMHLYWYHTLEPLIYYWRCMISALHIATRLPVRAGAAWCRWQADGMIIAIIWWYFIALRTSAFI